MARLVDEGRVQELLDLFQKGRPGNGFAFVDVVHPDPRIQSFMRSPQITTRLTLGSGIADVPPLSALGAETPAVASALYLTASTLCLTVARVLLCERLRLDPRRPQEETKEKPNAPPVLLSLGHVCVCVRVCAI